MSDQTLDKIGKTFESAERDAIHIAVMPVRAHRPLLGGEHVGISDGMTHDGEPIGIVDPFLQKVLTGEGFFVFLYPNTITSLKHYWSHPSIPDIASTVARSQWMEPDYAKQKSTEWLKQFMSDNDIGCSMDEMLETVLDAGANDGSEVCFGLDTGAGELTNEFWDHIERVTGEEVKEAQRASYFRCAC